MYAALSPGEHVGEAPWNDWEARSEEAEVMEVGLPENHIFIRSRQQSEVGGRLKTAR